MPPTSKILKALIDLKLAKMLISLRQFLILVFLTSNACGDLFCYVRQEDHLTARARPCTSTYGLELCVTVYNWNSDPPKIAYRGCGFEANVWDKAGDCRPLNNQTYMACFCGTSKCNCKRCLLWESAGAAGKEAEGRMAIQLTMAALNILVLKRIYKYF